MLKDMHTTPPTAPGKAVVFANRRAAVLWGCVAAFSLALFLSSRSGARGVAYGLLVLFALQAAISFALGVRLAKGKIALPRTLWNRAALLIVGRTSIPLPQVREINYLGRALTLEYVQLTKENTKRGVLFELREDRLAFFDEVRRSQPMVKIYRSHPREASSDAGIAMAVAVPANLPPTH